MSFVKFSPLYRKMYYFWFFLYFGITGSISGYIAARFYKLYKGTSWIFAAFITAITLPLIILSCIVIIELVDWYERSSSYVPFTKLLVIVIVTGLINTYLVFLGSYFGY